MVKDSPLRDKQRELRETAIIDAALALLSDKGFDAMTVDAVIDAVGISKPTFYLHFHSKEELGIRVVLRAINQTFEHLRALEEKLSPEKALRAIIDWLIDRHYGVNGFHSFTGTQALFSATEVHDAELRLAEEIAGLVRKGQREGTVLSHAPPMMIAQTLHSIMKDPVYAWQHTENNLDLPGFKSGVKKLLLG